MPLIRVPEHRREDLAAWARWERQDAILARTSRLGDLAARAVETIERFAARAPCYASVSWGKESTVLAHLIWTVAAAGGHTIPLVWIREEPTYNPHCLLVRDAFLAAHPHRYSEIQVSLREDADGWHATGTLEEGFRRACAQHETDRYVLGIRAEEAAGRRRRIALGLALARSCAPLGRWRIEDVYAYLHREHLPIHPAYAMSFGGRLDRRSLRVVSLGGDRAVSYGRALWEARYYQVERRGGGVRIPDASRAVDHGPSNDEGMP